MSHWLHALVGSPSPGTLGRVQAPGTRESRRRSTCTALARLVPPGTGNRKDVNNLVSLSLSFLAELCLGSAPTIIIRN